MTVNVGYALGELERALLAADHVDPSVRERAKTRIAKWENVIAGIASGDLAIGSRTPTAAPAWATLEVVQGGFATGALAAGGPLLPHEREIAARIGADDRRAIALHYLSDAGRRELEEMLASGKFRVEVAEEGALLAVAALLGRGDVEGASAILEAITPFVDRLRFHPQPASRPIVAMATVHVETVGVTRARIAAMDTPIEIRRMHESLTIWAPLLDRVVDLFFELEEAADWTTRGRALLAEYDSARANHRLCAKPHHPKQNLAILIHALRERTRGGTLSARDRGRVRIALAGHVQKHGAPGSDRRASHRNEQARAAAQPTRGPSAAILAEKLATLPADGSLASIEALTPGLWPSVAAKLQRCLDASVEELVERGVLTSGEAIAKVLPQISAHVRAMGFADPTIARLYAAIDAAFGRRRSLLLVDYAHQVRLEELPWVASLEPHRTDDGTSTEGARRLFASVTKLAIESFPQAIVPNPLVEELRTLGKRAQIDIPFVDELASDIFMGGFTAKFVRAAAIAARRLEGTLYDRYYALPIAEILAIENDLPARGPVPAFGELCVRRAEIAPDEKRSVARNGRVIEQQQILTTQNLVTLVDAAAVTNERFPELARRTFEWLVRTAQSKAPRRIHSLRAAKNVAYAWRQMIIYLSLAPEGSIDACLVLARAHLAEQKGEFRARFEPFFAGLEAAQSGSAPTTRLLGWSTGPHPLLGS